MPPRLKEIALPLIPAAVPGWFVALGLVLGALYALILPPLRVPDETGHMYRAWLVSQGICSGVPAIGADMDYRDLDHLVPWLELSPNSTGRDLLRLVDDAHNRPLAVVSQYFAVNLYSCLPYLPTGAAFRLGRMFTASPLVLLYLGRFANLLFYLALVTFAMRFLPEFQLPIALLGLMPMSLHQAASLSADAVTIAVSFVMTAYILRLALAGQAAQLRRSDYLLLLAGVIVCGLCKSNAGLVFLLLLIPGARFPDRRFAGIKARWLAIAGYIVLAFGTAALWQYFNRPNGEVYATLKAAAGTHLDENAAVIFERPTLFLSALGRTIVMAGLDYTEQFVGRLGWSEITLPDWIPCVYLLLLAVAAAAYQTGVDLTRRRRLLLVGIFLLNAASVLTAFWTTETSREHITSNQYVIPILGRYLIPFALLLLVAASRLATRLRRRWILLAPALTLVLVVNTVALHMVWDRFEAHSSTVPNRIRMALRLQFGSTPELAASIYDGLLVRRPGSSPEDGKVYLVSAGQKRWVTSGEWIPSHGYKWPDDVHTIPATDLAPIPEGDPIR